MGADAVGWSGVDGGTLTGAGSPGSGGWCPSMPCAPSPLAALLAAGLLPVVAPAALDAEGIICNVNADDAAAAIAGALGGRLLLLTDTDGVWGADGQRIP